MLNRVLLIVAGLFCVASAAKAQSFTLTIDAGFLRNTTGTTNEPVGGLLQLIASPSGTFSAPNTGSFVTGDNVLVSSFAMNYGGGTGEVIQNLNGFAFSSVSLTGNYTVTAGESLLLRYYPNLTFSATQNYNTTAPILATTFGQVRSNTIEFGATDGSETAWVVPAAGAAKDITYITTLDGGTYTDGPNGLGVSSFATFVVGPVPEPSAYAMFACGLAGLIGFRLKGRRNNRMPEAS